MSVSPSDLAERARALARYQRLVRLATGLLAALLVAALASGLLLVLSATDAPTPAWVASLAVASVAALLALGWTAWLAWTTPPPERIAALVEARFPDLQDRFVTAVEIGLAEKRLLRPSAVAALLAQRVAEQAEAAIGGRALRQAIGTRGVRRLAVAVAATALLLAISAIAFPSAWAGILAGPERPASSALAPRESFPQVKPIVGPSIANVALRLDYPAYTKQPAETLTTDLASVSAIVGTRVTISGAVRGEGASAALSLDGTPQRLAVQAGRPVTGSFTLTRDTTWQLRAVDAEGRSMQTPACRLRATPDRAPRVTLAEPGRDVALPEPRPVRLAYQAQDDWGLTKVALEYRAPGQAAWQLVTLFSGGSRSLADAWSWDLRPLRLGSGQAVAYRLTATDNDAVSGPKTSRTATYSITIGTQTPGPSVRPAEAVEQAAQRESESLEDLEAQAEELGKQLDEIIEALDKGELTESERAQRAAELNEAQRKVAEQADRVSRALTESEREAERQKMAPELQDKMRELHDLLQETMNQDLAEALKQIEQALQSPNPQDLQAGLQRARESQQDFEEQVRQAIELLKRARMERNVSRVANQAERLAADQEKLNQEREKLPSGRSDQAERQAEAQRNLQRREEGLESDLQHVAQDAAPIDQQAAERLSEIARQLQQSGARQNMQEAADRLQEGDPNAAQQPQQMALSDLSRTAAGLRQLQAQMSANAQQDLSRAAQELTRDALYLSREQERVMRQSEDIESFNARSASQGKTRRETIRRDQEALESGTRQLGGKLAEMARQTPLLDPSLSRKADAIADQMSRAAREASGGAGPQAAQTQREAMSGLNELAEELIRAGENMQQAAGQMAMQGLMQQLQGLAQQQRALNQQTQQMQGPGQTPRKQGGQGRLADEQQRIRDALERLLQKAGRASDLSDQLGEVPGDMREVEQDLRAERLGGQTVARQQDVLRRMLDAQRSVYKKDQQRRQRIAERPKPFRLPPSPPELTPRNPPPARSDVTPGEDSELPLDFEDVVRQYFRALAEMP
ncbi:MAG: DUF4175 family protein [Armatimonadetes bacterium]|nr:DUF4175 family protein [Armatimonadota bacterium]